MSKLYLNGVLCNGSGRGPNEYKVEDLRQIARDNGISIPSGTKKEDLCKLLLASGIGKKSQANQVSHSRVNVELPKPSSGKSRYNSIEELMSELGVSDARRLIGFSESELEDIIVAMKLYDGKITMTEFLKDYTGSERVKKFLVVLAEKYCRCLKGLEKSKGYTATAVCTSSIFTNRGLKGPGASFQCEPTPLLLAPKGKSIVLEKK